MKAFAQIAVLVAGIAGGALAVQASPPGGCASKTAHGVWDCR